MIHFPQEPRRPQRVVPMWEDGKRTERRVKLACCTLGSVVGLLAYKVFDPTIPFGAHLLFGWAL